MLTTAGRTPPKSSKSAATEAALPRCRLLRSGAQGSVVPRSDSPQGVGGKKLYTYVYPPLLVPSPGLGRRNVDKHGLRTLRVSSNKFAIHNKFRINEDEPRMDARTFLLDRNSDRASLRVRFVGHFRQFYF